MSGLAPTQSSVRFGVFELDLQTGELRKSGVLLRLPPQPFKVLALLVSRPAQLVTREEIREQTWGTDTFVDFEHGLNSAIKKIRDTLGDDPETPRYIETLPRRGYRFIAPVNGIAESSEGQAAIRAAPSPQQTISGAKPARKHARFRWAMIGTAATVAAGLAVGGWLLYSRKAHVLTEKDTIVLADFINTTGDPVFDGTLRQGLSVQLEQTPVLRIVSDDKVTQTLKMMEQPLDARLTPSLAREVCQRTDASVEIEGSIAALGKQYVLGLRALKCVTGETLAEEQVTTDAKEKVLSALSVAASELRRKLGESRASLQRYDVPLTQATTSLLEALQAYNQGIQSFWKSDFASAISSLERAVELDPNFAMAYNMLGAVYGTVGNNELLVKNTTRAYGLRDRVSELEKFAISAGYYSTVRQELDKNAQFYEQWTEMYPRDPAGWSGLANIADLLGRSDQALAASLKAVRLNPSSFTYGYASYMYLHGDRFGEARAMIDQARSRKIEPFASSWDLYTLAFLRNDRTGMAEQTEHPWTDMPPGIMEDMQGATAAYYGHLSDARDWNRRAVASALSLQLKDQAAAYTVGSALREALLGNFREARKGAKQATKLSTDPDVRGGAALALALSGDSGEAKRLTEDIAERFPEGTLVRFYHVPTIQAALALRQGDPHGAIESLGVAARYELAYSNYAVPMIPVYVRGGAYLAAHEGVEAAAEFQKILDHRGLVADVPMSAFVGNPPIGPLARLGLARAYALQDDRAKAKTAYQDFLTLWKDSDPDIPILKEAKAEYVKLGQ